MFEQQEIAFTDDYDDAGFKNEIVALSDAALLANIREIQQNNNVKLSDKVINNLGRCSLDVEMETGTGKTYVYIKTMYELNKHYGWSKFIVVVPSIAIREGVKKSFEITHRKAAVGVDIEMIHEYSASILRLFYSKEKMECIRERNICQVICYIEKKSRSL